MYSNSSLSREIFDTAKLENDCFFGCVPFEDIQKDMAGYAAKFSEGSPALNELLLSLWTRGFPTTGCCAGHNNIRYYKDTLFGGKKCVDQREYLKNRGSGKYHREGDETTPFLAFPQSATDDPKGFRDKLDVGISEVLGSLPIDVFLGNKLTVIHLKSNIEEDDREWFFKVLKTVMQRNILELGVKSLDDDTSLDDRISDASEAKASENVFVNRSEPARY